MNKVAILGTRGIPAMHGGFETFAEYLALYLQQKKWDVTVYCQEDGHDGAIREDLWRGIKRIIIPVSREGASGTMRFDWLSIRHVLSSDHKLVLTLGYNTAAFCFPYRIRGIKNIINMDGIEWQRDKWAPHERAWLWLNERCGCLFGDHLVADHPEIAHHLARRSSRKKITMIPYGAPEVIEADIRTLDEFGVTAGNYGVVIARPEPENSLLEIVAAFSRKKRRAKLVILGNYDVARNDFHRAVQAAASDEVLFPGAIYDKRVVEALRFYARFYVHGHRVGGTNPSLVEALGAGSAVLAHDNRFNRWVAGPESRFFDSEEQCAEQMEELLSNESLILRMKKASSKRYRDEFTWAKILNEYESLLLSIGVSPTNDTVGRL